MCVRNLGLERRASLQKDKAVLPHSLVQLVTVDLSNCQADVSSPSVQLCSSCPRASTEVLSYDRIGLGNLIAYLCL